MSTIFKYAGPEKVRCCGLQVRRGEPNARNEIRGSFARASRCRGYITVLSGGNERAERAWPELRTNVLARIF
jgi:hypothetical protein